MKKSLPSRERGLKLDEFQSETGDYCVAPLAGAWIEIPEIKHHRNVIVSLPSRERGLKYCDKCEGCTWRGVAPLAGAWIEIRLTMWARSALMVAPLAGAWIEMK